MVCRGRESVVQSVGERSEHCPCPEMQGSHSSFIPPLILVLHFISFHSLRSLSYFQWSTWGQRDVSTLDTNTHTQIQKHKDTPGHKSASWKGQVHLKGLANGSTGGAKSFCVPGLPKGFLTLTYPEDRLPRCNSLTWFLYAHYLWPIFVFYFLVLWLCLFVSFSQGYSNRGPFDDSCAPKRRKETTQV